MKINFWVEYVNKEQETVESMACFDPANPDHRKMIHDVLDEYLDNNVEWTSDDNENPLEKIICGFKVSNVICSLHKD